MRSAVLPVLLTLLVACDAKPAAPVAGPVAAPAVAAAGPAAEAPKGPQTYYFGIRETHTKVSFQSKNDLTDILGSTSALSGNAVIDFGAGSGSCELSVPAQTLNSGMADRDRAMMGTAWLDVKKYPTIEFKSTKAALTEAPNGWTIDGKFTLHGVTKDLTIKADVKAVPASVGNSLGFGDGPCVKVKTDFKVKLADYGIEIPATAIATVQPEISIGVAIWGSTIKPKDGPVAVKPTEDEAPVKVTRAPKVSEEGIEGSKYALGKKPQLAQLVATSETELETVTVQTKTIGGVVGLDKQKGLGKVRLAIPVDSLRSGIDLRDEHLRGEAWLDFAKFKTIEFESTKATKKDDKTWEVEGDFTMHGVKKPIKLDVTLKEIPLETIQKAHWGDSPGIGFASRFQIKLSDFGIKIPSQAAAKVSDVLTIAFDVVGLLKE